jgi:hypothetical protein
LPGLERYAEGHETMTRNMTPTAIGFACMTAAGFMMLGIRYLQRPEITTSLRSPDQRLRAELVDRPHFPTIDRNFSLRIVGPDGSSRRIFTSPDESPSGVGTDRFFWSTDSKGLLLIGKRFWVRDGAQLDNGEFLYLLYDVPSGKIWCNSDQRGPPFGPNELAGYDFGEPLTQRASTTSGPP